MKTQSWKMSFSLVLALGCMTASAEQKNTLSQGSKTQSSRGRSCKTPWGTSVPHGSAIMAYWNPMGNPSCQSEARWCKDGRLSGSYQYSSCVE